MTKEQRLKLLQKLSRSSEGLALQEFLEERIKELKEEAIIESKNWDELLGYRYAIKYIVRLIRTLNLLKKEITENKKSEYQ